MKIFLGFYHLCLLFNSQWPVSVSKALGRNFSRLSSRVYIQAEPIGKKAHVRAVIKGSVGPNFGLRQVGNLLSANFHLLALLSVLSFNLRDFFFLIQICRVAKIFCFHCRKDFRLMRLFFKYSFAFFSTICVSLKLFVFCK